MIGKLAILMCLALLAGCAQPKYEARGDIGRASSGLTAAEKLVLPSSQLRAWISWEKLPTESDFGSFILKVGRENKADGSPVLEEMSGSLKVILWMPSMGHGSSPVKIERLDVGTYRVNQVFFTMPGDWEIRVQRTSEENGVEEAALPLRI